MRALRRCPLPERRRPPFFRGRGQGRAERSTPAARSGLAAEEPLSAQRAEDVRVVAKGGAVQILGQFTQKGLTFLLVAVAVRVLGPAEYGLYRQVAQVMTILTTLASGGFPQAAVRFITRARVLGDAAAVRGTARVTLAGAGIVSLIIVLGVVIWSEPLARAFADASDGVEYLSFLLKVGVVYVPLYAAMQVLRFCTQAYKTMTPGVIVGNIIQPLSRFLFIVAALSAGFAVTGAIVGLVLSAAVAVFAGVFFFRRLLTEDERLARASAGVGPILRFAFPQAGVALLSTQSLGLGVVLIGIYGTNRQVGLYGVAQALQLAGGLFLTSIAGIWGPLVVDIYERGDIPRLQSLYQTINRWVATFSVPVFMALMFQPELFTLILGGEAAVKGAFLVPILAAGNMFFVTTGPNGQLLSMSGRPGVNLINSIASVALYVGLGVILIQRYGVVGMAVADAVVTALLNVTRVIEGKLLIGVQPFGRSFLKPMVATLGAVAVLAPSRIFFGHAIPAAIGGLVAGGLVYFLILRALGSDPEERHVIEVVKARVVSSFRRRG